MQSKDEVSSAPKEADPKDKQVTDPTPAGAEPQKKRQRPRKEKKNPEDKTDKLEGADKPQYRKKVEGDDTAAPKDAEAKDPEAKGEKAAKKPRERKPKQKKEKPESLDKQEDEPLDKQDESLDKQEDGEQ